MHKSVLQYLFGLVVVTMFIAACNGSGDRDQKGNTVKADTVVGTIQAVDNRTFEVDEYDSTTGDMDEDLYGKFFSDRAVFYVIDKPEKYMLDCSVKQMTVCYLDQKLAQVKYNLDGNPANELIRGNAAAKLRIMGCDSINRKVLNSEPPVIKEGDRHVINKHLTNYLLRWKLNNKETLLRVKGDECEYIERILDYPVAFKSIETSSGS